MEIIKVNKIDVLEKDVIEIKEWEDFRDINKRYYDDGFVFNLNGIYYIIGEKVMYFCKYKK